MRILYVVTGAAYGGAVAHVIGLIRADIQNGHIVGLVAAPEKRLLSEIEHTGVQFFPNRYFEQRVKIYSDIRSIWPVFQAIRVFRPQIISAHSTKAGYAARIACALLGKPSIFTAHGWAFSSGQSGVRRKLIPLAERTAALFTDRIICVSQYDLELARRHKIASDDKLIQVHNGIDPQPFLEADGTLVQQELSINQVPVFTMIARLAPPKDPLTLLAVCKSLKGEFKCLIIGEGEQRPAAEKYVKQNGLGDKVVFTGERKDIPQILAASDIFVLISHWEGLPLTIIEAGMAGLPSVASRVGGVPELIQEGVTGFTISPRDTPALAKSLQTLLDDASLRQKFGQAAKAKMRREFSFDRMYQETQRVYRQVLEYRSGRANR
jgi:glycosyltransferase involved in cell wall biosynthesis